MLICEKKAVQLAEKEENTEMREENKKTHLVFFLSLVKVRQTLWAHFLYLYKRHNFISSNVNIKSDQDLLEFCDPQNKGRDKNKIDIYNLVEYFVKKHRHGPIVLDAVLILKTRKCKLY